MNPLLLFLCLCGTLMPNACTSGPNMSNDLDEYETSVSDLDPQLHSIQEAIDNAKPNSVLEIPSGTYKENLVITKPISIVGVRVGSVKSPVIIDGMSHGSVVSITYGSNVTLTNIVLFNGSSDEGGGIYNEGTLNMTHCVVQNSNSTKRGGLICNKGRLYMKDMALVKGYSDNGGGIYNSGILTFEDTLLTSNYATYGGGIYNTGHVTMSGRSQISRNLAFKSSRSRSLKSLYATCAGGGVYNAGQFLMKGGTIRFNLGVCPICFRGAGVYNIGKFFLIDGDVTFNLVLYKPISYLASSQGGGFYNAGKLDIKNGIVKRNSADLGGGVCNRGDFWLEGGTITLNTAQDGGGVYNKVLGWVFLYGGEITQNEAIYFGGGIYNKNHDNSIQGDRSIVHDNVREDFG